MKIALVHDYIREFGGAERVLAVLSEMYPQAPIYTSFVDRGSNAYEKFKDKKIIESWVGKLLSFGKLYSPFRFLIPWVWGVLDLSDYDLVITSASWYIARGFRIGNKTRVICYCHTPPRNLYGYQTAINWMGLKWGGALVNAYATVVNHFLRIFDYQMAQVPNRTKDKILAGVDQFVVNSHNVEKRVAKFYRRESEVIYPPVLVGEIIEATKSTEKGDNFLIVSRLVESKGLLEAAEAAKKTGRRLRIAGTGLGFSNIEKKLRSDYRGVVELLGHISDEELWREYARAKGFIALARDEDFGMTVVEAMAAGTPVIAFNGGGFRETVVDGETGVLIDDTDVATLEKAFGRFDEIKWERSKIQKQARKFSREIFEERIGKIVRDLYSS
jgi:glycosyltransferase involved in cell wall biosynthesis